MASTWMQIAVCLAVISSVAAIDPRSRQDSNVRSQEPDDGPHEVYALPGFDGDLPSLHRAGYVTVALEAGRRLYYYLVGSESKAPDQDPLLIWLTGGPGCSSLDAFTYENGPFSFHLAPGRGVPRSADDVTLTRNPYSWSKVAHVLYVDSPAGTGMSYSTKPQDGYHTDDHQTIEDLLQLVLGVLEDMPDLRGKDMYIAGESYGGVYVPLLARRILKHNRRVAGADAEDEPSQPSQPQQQQQQLQQQQGQQQKQQGQVPRELGMHGNQQRPRSRRRLLANGGGGSAAESGADLGRHGRVIRLVGYMVGNGVTDDEVDGDSMVPFAWDCGLLDEDTFEFVRRACNGAYWNATRGGKCWEALDVVDAAVGDVNPYDVLDPCFFPRPQPTTAGGGGADAGMAARRAWPLAARFEEGRPVGNWWRGAAGSAAAGGGRSGGGDGGGGGGKLGHTIPCADRRAALIYYNDDGVRRAIHAVPSNLGGRWEPCSDVLHYTHTAPSMIPVHRHLLQSGLRALVFSGLQDYVVPFTGTRRWTSGLGLPIEFPWRPWKLGRQVKGHAVRYRAEGEGALTYATVIGAGHMVPQTKPESALTLVQIWLAREI